MTAARSLRRNRRPLFTLPVESLPCIVEMADYALPEVPMPRGGVVLDLGAHVGAFALFALRWWKPSRVHCYEPHPNLAQLCRENLSSEDAVRVHELAVVGSDYWRHGGKGTLREGSATLLATSLRDLGSQEGASYRVGLIRAEELPPCDLLKVDTEGLEVDILRDYAGKLRRARAVLVEAHTPEDRFTVTEILVKARFVKLADTSINVMRFQRRGDTTPC